MVDNVTKSQILEGLDSLKGAVVSLSDEVAGIKTEVAGIKVELTGVKIEVVGITKEVAGIKGEVVGINKKLDRHEVLLSHLSGLPREVFDIKQDTSLIKEDTAKIPRIQQLLDKTATANALDKQERTFMKNRIDGHEERLVVVENTLSIKPSAEVF